MKTRASAVLVIVVSALSGCSFTHRESKTLSQMQQVDMAVKLYESEYGKLDVVDSRDVFTQLHQGNRKKINFIEPTAEEKKAGQFLDAWNQPLSFFRLADGSLQIVSGGRDQKVGTSDDIYTK